MVKNIKVMLTIILGIFLFSFISSATLPAQKVGENVLLYQTCINSTYTNITSVIIGNHLIIQNVAMTEAENDYYTYNFTDTSIIGDYIVTTRCDKNGEDEIASYDFEVTPTGKHLGLDDFFANISIMIFFISLILTMIFITNKINYEAWHNSIIKKYENRNFVKVILSSMGYNFIKNRFIWYYLIGLPIILIITNIAYIFNVESMAHLMQIVLSIYYFGFLLVAVFFFGYLQEWIKNTLDQLKDRDYGIE